MRWLGRCRRLEVENAKLAAMIGGADAIRDEAIKQLEYVRKLWADTDYDQRSLHEREKAFLQLQIDELRREVDRLRGEREPRLVI